jgi:hypothetical protein
MNEKIKKIAGLGLTGLVALSAGFGIGAYTIEPETIVINDTIVKTVEVPVVETHTVEVPVETIVEVEKEVFVDNGNLLVVLEHIYDNNGEISYLTEDLDDDEVELIAERVIFINDIKKIASDYAKEEFVDLIDKEEFGDVVFDEDDIERVRVQDEDDEIVIDNVDFEDKDADVKVSIRFEQDDVKYLAGVIVEFKDGEVHDMDLDFVEVRD